MQPPSGSRKHNIAIIIPSLEPDERLPQLVGKIAEIAPHNPVIIVNDGSGSDYSHIFDSLASHPKVTVLHHEKNYGKGRALKTAFAHYLEKYPEGHGAVTADADGQHTPEDIKRTLERLAEEEDTLVLGVRDFSGENIPFRSRLGNNLTKKILKLMVGYPISDTQTGLRGIPAPFMKELCHLAGDRFEYETSMLIVCKHHGMRFAEETIETIYIDSNRTSHFHPVADSFKIYALIFRRLMMQMGCFLSAGILSAALDIALWALLFYYILPSTGRLFWAVAIARTLSAAFNYFLNKNITFRKHTGKAKLWDANSFIYYIILCGVIMLASYGMTKAALDIFPGVKEIYLKIVCDIILFIGSFAAQKLFIFRR